MSTATQSPARVARKLRGRPTSDGAGVKLTRVIGTPQLDMLDPFLMLDEFGTDKPEDYLAGFPEHPHRGFETVTYMLDGRMRHKDNHGNEGLLVPGQRAVDDRRPRPGAQRDARAAGRPHARFPVVGEPAREATRWTRRSTRNSRPIAFPWRSPRRACR